MKGEAIAFTAIAAELVVILGIIGFGRWRKEVNGRRKAEGK